MAIETNVLREGLEIRPSKTTPLQLAENALRVLEKRYLRKDLDGKAIETPEEMLRRVAWNIAQADSHYDPKVDVDSIADEFYHLMSGLLFLPNSPTLMNAGRELQQLSACFVLPVEDSMESIFEAVKHTALIHKSGGGTGFSFSRLRPSGDVVGSTSGISSGPISFMTVFDSATEAIKQGGTRRGANMGILRVDHPDIMEFITCKEDNNRLNNFNISVALTSGFMKAVEADTTYELINPRTKKVTKRLKASVVFEKIVEMAWKNGDPGIIFIDRINEDNPTPHLGEVEATNPCGEQPLLPYESCNLGSINLARMVRKPVSSKSEVVSSHHLQLTTYNSRYEIDWDRLEYVTKKAVHFLDNVIDMNKYPIPQIMRMTEGNRKIGLGVMGFADMLIRLGIPYDSKEALECAERVASFIEEKGREASCELAEKRGVFLNYKGSIYDGSAERGGGNKGAGKRKVRNATVTTIAPTGTISIIAGCSSGIEPLFALAFTRNVLDGANLVEVNPLFEEIAKEKGFYSPTLMDEVASHGTLKDIGGIPEDVIRLFTTSHDITPEWHIRMQAAFQKYTDNAVSKTVNFPQEATKEDVAKVYMLAYKLGCKGVTVYRDGSREVQVLNKGQGARGKGQDRGQGSGEKDSGQWSVTSGQELTTHNSQLTTFLSPKPRGEVTFGATRKMKTGCGNLYVTINEDEEGRPFEVFTQIGKAGGCAASQCEAIGRMVSLSLRSGIQPEEVIKQMKGISCHVPVFSGNGGKIFSCSDAVAKALEWYVNYKIQSSKHAPADFKQGFKVQGSAQWSVVSGQEFTTHNSQLNTQHSTLAFRGACPDCGAQMHYEEGCAKCVCGYSDCG